MKAMEPLHGFNLGSPEQEEEEAKMVVEAKVVRKVEKEKAQAKVEKENGPKMEETPQLKLEGTQHHNLEETPRRPTPE